MKPIPNTEININFDSPSKVLDVNERRKMGAKEENSIIKENSSETKDQEPDEDRVKALIAERR